MATRSYSPIRAPDVLTEDKDRQIRKLKTSLAPLKEQLQQLPLLEQKFLNMENMYSSLQRETSVLEGEYRLREETAARAQAQLNEEIIILNNDHKQFILELKDLQAAGASLYAQCQKSNLQLQDHQELGSNLYDKLKELDTQNTRIKNNQKNYAQDSLRFLKKSEALGIQNDEVSLKTAQCKGIITQFLTDKKILIQKLQLFQNQNNTLDAQICAKQDDKDLLKAAIKKQEAALAFQEQRTIQLQTRVDKLSSDLTYINSNINLQIQIGNDVTTQIKNADRALTDISTRTINTNNDRTQNATQNQKVLAINYQLKKDWQACEEHLINLQQQNQLLLQHLQRYMKQDDETIRIIFERRNRSNKMPGGYVLKSSRVTGL